MQKDTRRAARAKPVRDRQALRIGIALAGGGAKGAYQVGCLQALREAGVGRVAAIAGTSVGAIHGVMLAADRVDHACDIWTRLRWRDVIRVNGARFHRLPLWVLAALNSEFSPFKVWRLSHWMTQPASWRRAVYPSACAAAAIAAIALGLALPALRVPAVAFAVALAVSGALAILNPRLRRHFLGTALVSHAPLASRLDEAISPDDWQRIRDSGTPVFATVSQYQPYTRHGVPWGGWVPHYARLDRMSREAAIDTLMAGTAMPGFSDVSSDAGLTRVDGAWTDNLPAAPLLFDPDLDLDLALVVHLKKTVRHRHRHNSLLGVASLLVSEALVGRRCDEDSLTEWARTRWTAAGRVARDGGRLPRVALIVPSRRLGNFFLGTYRFSPDRAQRLIELGRRDTERVLEDLGLRPHAEAITLQQAPRTRLGTLAAGAEQALS